MTGTALLKLAVGLSMAAAVPAAAQRVAGDDEPFVSALGDVGGLLVRGLSIDAQLRTLYDDNIRRRGKGLTTVDGKDKSDFRFSPSVALTNVVPLGRQQLVFSGNLGRDYYARTTELNRTSYGLGVAANLRAGNYCTGRLSASLSRRQSLLSEAAVFDDNTVQNVNYIASADCVRPIGLGFGGSVGRSERDNKGSTRRLFDSRTMNYDAHLNYSLPVLGVISLGGSYQRIDYPNRPVFIDATGSNTHDGLDVYAGNLGFRRAIGSRLSVRGGLSYYKAKPDPRDAFQPVAIPTADPLNPLVVLVPNTRNSFSGSGYNLGLAYRPGPRLSIDISALRDLAQTSTVGALFTVRNSYGVDVGYLLSQSITAGFGGTYDKRSYRSSFVSAEEPVRRIGDDISRVYARATYSPPRLFDVDFEIARQWRNSNPSIYDFSSTTAVVTLRIKLGKN
jgi:hypothetical protein